MPTHNPYLWLAKQPWIQRRKNRKQIAKILLKNSRKMALIVSQTTGA